MPVLHLILVQLGRVCIRGINVSLGIVDDIIARAFWQPLCQPVKRRCIFKLYAYLQYICVAAYGVNPFLLHSAIDVFLFRLALHISRGLDLCSLGIYRSGREFVG